MNNNLLNVPYSMDLEKKTLQTIKQNIIVSLGLKFIFLVLAGLEFAVGADSGMG